MVKNITTVEEKLSFYKKLLKHDDEAYLIFTSGPQNFPIYIFKTNKAKSGFAELKCQLLGGYTYQKDNPQQAKFMKEQGYTIIDDLAYDVQPVFELCDFDVYFGDFEVVTKADCAIWLKSHS